MNKYQKRAVYISIIMLAFFLVSPLITHHLGFFFWGLLLVFMVLMGAFPAKRDKRILGDKEPLAYWWLFIFPSYLTNGLF